MGVYIPNIKGRRDVERTIIHEVVGHLGIKGLLGEKGHAAFLDSVWGMMSAIEKERYLNYPGVADNASGRSSGSPLGTVSPEARRAAADEFVAHVAELTDIQGARSMWRRIVTALRQALRKLGRMVFDYVQMFADLAAKKLPLQTYAKEVLYSKIFGLTGAKINLSLVPKVVEGGVAPGLDKDGNYVWQEGQTFPYEDAVELMNAEGYRENCGTIYHTIGINGSDGVTPYALRPGWHATDYPSAPHIGTTGGEGGSKPRYRKANQRWFLCEIAADVDYNPEVRERYAKLHPDDKEVYEKLKGDMPERIPENGFYNFRTNSNANPNQSWYIAGAIRILKPVAEKEVKRINAEGGVPEDLPYKDGYKTFVEEDTDGPDGGPESGGRAKKKKSGSKKKSVVVPRDILEVARESAQRISNTGAGGTSFRVESDRRIDESLEVAYAAEPTEAQKEAGNYKKKHVRVDGHANSIENEAGPESGRQWVRRGRDADGKEWATEMKFDYGYIRGTEGVDGDHIDVFLSATPERGDVFVVDQVNKDGTFDEHKVMYGFSSEGEARAAYLSNYEEGWQGLGAITRVSREEFKKWVRSSKRKTKPFAEYKGVKFGGTQFRENTKNPTWNATTYALSNLLSRAKAPVLDVTSKSDVAKLQQIFEDIKKKISDMPKNGYGVNGIRHIINEAIKANVKSADSSYKDLEINGCPTVIRISNHSAKVLNFSEKNINIGIVVKTSNSDFRAEEDVDYIEFMYYGDQVENNPRLQSDILSGLGKYIETSSFEGMPVPNRLCASGEYKTILQRLGLKPTNKGVVNVDKLGLRGKPGSIGLTTFRVTEDAGGFQSEIEVSRLDEETETTSVAREAVGTDRGGQTMFRITGVPAVAAAAVYELRVRTAGYQVQEALQDSMLGLRAAYDAIIGRG